MTLFSCPRTSELKQALKAGHLLSTWEPELQQHVEACRNCSEFLLISQNFHSARESSIREVPPLSPGLLWWRAQLRRRNYALQQISQPTFIFGKLALGLTFAVALVALFYQRQSGSEWIRWLLNLQHPAANHAALAAQILNWNLLLGLVSLGAIALLGVFAVFLATDKN